MSRKEESNRYGWAMKELDERMKEFLAEPVEVGESSLCWRGWPSSRIQINVLSMASYIG